MKNVVRTILMSLASFTLPGTVWAQSYTVIDLAGPNAEAFDINAAGTVAGVAYPSGEPRAAVFNRTSKEYKNLGKIDGSNYSSATAISDNGQVAGRSFFESSARGNIATRFLNPPSQNLDLGALGGDGSEALDINNAGQVVGVGYLSTSNYHAVAFGRTPAENIDLGTLGGTWSAAFAINNRGEIVGSAGTPGDAKFRATLFSGTGSDNIDLGTLGGEYSQAFAISSNGLIVGESRSTEGGNCAALFSRSGPNVNLETLPNALRSSAYGVNSSSQVVGEVLIQPSWDPRGFYHANGKMILLNDLISSSGGWNIVSAKAINDDGQIACTAITGSWSDSPRHALLLIPIPKIDVSIEKTRRGAVFTIKNQGNGAVYLRLARDKEVIIGGGGRPSTSSPKTSSLNIVYSLTDLAGQSTSRALPTSIRVPFKGMARIEAKVKVRKKLVSSRSILLRLRIAIENNDSKVTSNPVKIRLAGKR